MSVLQGKKILLGVTGGIAAYKTPFLVRLLRKKGAEVKVVMTYHATEFVTPLTLSTVSKNEVGVELADRCGNWTNHVELGLWADYMLIAPATANTISKMAQGESNNLLLTTYLSMRAPVYVAPAMDLDMWKHKSTQDNLAILQSNDVTIIPPESGELASGLQGTGRMAEPENIIGFLEKSIEETLSLSHKKVLITAGPTYEPIDPVRFIGNHSSGKMGFAIASAAAHQGAQVVLISGPTCLTIDNDSIELHSVTTAQQMYDKVFEYYEKMDVAIMSAAVADFRPKEVATQKIKKTENETPIIELVKNPDILQTMGMQKNQQYLVGFALETHDEIENAKKKIQKKNLDLIVLNSLNDKGAGFQTSTNKVTFIDKENTITEHELKSKDAVAEDLINYIAKQINP